MLLTKREWPILVVNLIYIPAFAIVAASELNLEFLLYIGVVVVAGGLVVWKQRDVKFGPPILWGLTLWGLMHLSGGNIHIDGDVLYNLTLLPLVPEPYFVLRYDQVVHTFGFGVATLVCYHVLKPHLRPEMAHRRAVWILVVLMGAGVGALNEVVEFAAVVAVPDTNVGGYTNTAVDLVCNLIGGLIATGWLVMTTRQVRVAE